MDFARARVIPQDDLLLMGTVMENDLIFGVGPRGNALLVARGGAPSTIERICGKRAHALCFRIEAGHERDAMRLLMACMLMYGTVKSIDN